MASDATTLFQGLFLGEYDHTLDAQCRVSLPSDWRNREGSTELVLIPARGKALVLGICLSGVAFAAVPL